MGEQTALAALKSITEMSSVNGHAVCDIILHDIATELKKRGIRRTQVHSYCIPWVSLSIPCTILNNKLE